MELYTPFEWKEGISGNTIVSAVRLNALEQAAGAASSDLSGRLSAGTLNGEFDSKYEKPNPGIPSTDMTTEVQTSLAKADEALPGNYQPSSTSISDATVIGKTLITTPDAATARDAIGAGTSNLALGATSSDAMAGNAIVTLAAATTLPVGLANGTLIARY